MMLVCLTKTLISLLLHSFAEDTDVGKTIREIVTEHDAEHARMKSRNGHAYFGGLEGPSIFFCEVDCRLPSLSLVYYYNLLLCFAFAGPCGSSDG